MRWLSAQDYQEQLSPRLWQAVQVSFWAAFAPLLLFLPTGFSGTLLAGLLIKRFLMSPRFYPLLIVLANLVFGLGIVQLLSQWRTVGLTLTIVNFFVLLAVVKLMESRNRRDIEVLFLLHLLLFLATMMYSQDLFVFVYMLLSLGMSLWVLMRVTVRDQPVLNLLRWKMIVKIMGLALPFTVLLFFLVPRMSPMWGGLTQNQQSVTGLAGEMNMGDLARLAQSNEVSFRVHFHGKAPKPEELYWRGPVLWHFDGLRWTQRAQDAQQSALVEIDADTVVHYTLLPIKNDLPWLTGLDVVVNPPKSVRYGRAGQMMIPQGVPQPAKYELQSALAYRLGGESALSRAERRDALGLPEQLAMPKTRAFAKALWQDNGQSVEGFAQGFFDYVRNNPFYYTLEPHQGMGDVDTFLFGEQGQVGFCEHYANAFTLAARSVGIPARVVTGYQGGTRNPLNDEWVVREENAHAWSELWIEGRGWVRYDPTAAVAPNRILQARLDRESLTGEDSRALFSRWSERMAAVAWLRNALDATQSFWQHWVVDLNRDQQRGLLQKLGLERFGTVALLGLLFAGIALLLVLLLVYQRLHRPEAGDKVARAAARLLRRLEKNGEVKGTSEPLHVFLRRLAKTASEPRKALLLQAAECYENQRYLEQPQQERLIKFLKQIS